MSKAAPTLLVIAGTRPEILKLAPLVRELRTRPTPLTVKTCLSGQHHEILQSVMGDLDVDIDVELAGPPEDSTLSQSFAWLLKHLASAIAQARPDGVVVQGDTNTVLAGAMAAFHQHLPVFHVEAGLRTADPRLPYPEEMNRRLVTRLAALHFAPTERARQNLLSEGIAPESVVLTGNTGIDTLRIYADQSSAEAAAIVGDCRPGSRRLLVTLHRRENAAHVGEVTRAVKRLCAAHPDVDVMWLLHLNGIRAQVIGDLRGHPAVHLIEPQSYSSFVHLMKSSFAVLTDSGGVQEEAPTLGRPVLVLRNATERPEAVEQGNAVVVGCNADRIVAASELLLTDREHHVRMSQAHSPFGDGRASRRIVEALERFYGFAVGSADAAVKTSRRGALRLATGGR